MIDIVEHAVDNRLRSEDYVISEMLDSERVMVRKRPLPQNILPRQFGYWFNTGPGLADPDILTYDHKLLEAQDVRILGQDGVVVYSGGWVDSISLNYIRPDLPGCQFRREAGGLRVANVSRYLSGSYFLGFNAGHNNYAHWITDQLPLFMLYMEKFRDRGVKILLPKMMMRFCRDFLDILGISDSETCLIGDEVVQVEHLIHGSTFSFDRIPYSIPRLIERFKQKYSDVLAAVPPRKVFISRKDTNSRALLNASEVEGMFIDKGFDIVVPGEMTARQQIAAFGSAQDVVGVHGAAMANIAFCKPGTRVLELFPEYTLSPHFWMLANHFDLSYGLIVGTSLDHDRALSSQSGSWDAPFVINTDLVAQYLRNL